MFKPITYFVSGSNHAGELRGLAWSGEHFGVCAPELNAEAMAELGIYTHGPQKLFVDSGAFGEVHFPDGVPTIKKEITHGEWVARLDTYFDLVRIYGRRLYVVAPDCVAHQARTLERLERYAEQVRGLFLAGANVIVPVQKGELSMTEFRRRATAILGIPDTKIIWGIPLKKDATGLEDLAAFCADLHRQVGLARVHMLGLGPKSPRYGAAVSAVWCNAPGVELSCDSVRITAMVGRTNGPGGGPRALTAARDALMREGVTGTATLKAAMIIRVFHTEELATRGPDPEFAEEVA